MGQYKQNHSNLKTTMSSSQLRTHLLLLTQASVGISLATVGLNLTGGTEASVFYWFCLAVSAIYVGIILNSIMNIIWYVRRKKWEYEDIETGDRKDALKSSLKRLKMEKKKFSRMKAELVRKGRELEKREKELKDSGNKQVKRLYGGYGYCNY